MEAAGNTRRVLRNASHRPGVQHRRNRHPRVQDGKLAEPGTWSVSSRCFNSLGDPRPDGPGQSAARRTRAAGQGLRQIRRQGILPLDPPPGHRMVKADPPRVEERPGQAQPPRLAPSPRRPGRPSRGVRPRPGGPGSGGSARSEGGLPPASPDRLLPHPHLGGGLPTGRPAHTDAGPPPLQRGVDQEPLVPRRARTSARYRRSTRCRRNMAVSAAEWHRRCHDHEAGGAHVEPVHDARPVRSPPGDRTTPIPSNRFTRVPVRRTPWGA